MSSTPSRAVLVGIAYYAGARIGITQTITPEGIAVLWPPNAFVLAAFLLFPYRQWPWVALAALVAECAADLPAFPLSAALAFGLINLLEVSLAAWFIRLAVREDFDFDRLYKGIYFLLFGPLLASGAAALLGAAVYVVMGRTDAGFAELWRIWWFGDALGLIVLAPPIIRLWRQLETGAPLWLTWGRLFEAFALWAIVVLLAAVVFIEGTPLASRLYFAPMLLLPLGIWAALRFGVLGAALTAALMAALAIGHLVRGIYPYPNVNPQQAVWLTQEYLSIVAAVSIGLGILMHEMGQQRRQLREQDNELQEQNARLEQHIAERTADLEQVNRDLRNANARLEQLATTDFLTSFANRRHFEELGERELRRLARDHITASLVMFDLDYFKAVNDRYGHDVGDEVLRQISPPVSHSMRPRDLCGRSGGEEFVLLLAEADEERACRIAERIRAGIAALSIEHQRATIQVTASFGVAEWDGKEDLGTLMHRADAALYRAKRTGRNRVST